MKLDPPEHTCTRIYGLMDPRTGVLRYIGKTSRSLQQRLRGHLFDSKKKRNHRERWISSLLESGLEPVIEEFDCVAGDGSDAERSFIGVARALGCRLVNATDGGDGVLGRKLSADAKARIGAANKKQKGTKRSAQMRARLSAALMGNKHSLGKKLSKEHKLKLSLALRGRVVSDAFREKQRARMLGYKPSPASIAKNRATNKANHFFRVLVRSARVAAT